MDETQEIRSLGEGRYTFLIGRQRYTLNSPLEEECFVRVVSAIQELVDSFPPKLTQEDRLFLALMSMSHKIDDIHNRIDKLLDANAGARKED